MGANQWCIEHVLYASYGGPSNVVSRACPTLRVTAVACTLVDKCGCALKPSSPELLSLNHTPIKRSEFKSISCKWIAVTTTV